MPWELTSCPWSVFAPRTTSSTQKRASGCRPGPELWFAKPLLSCHKVMAQTQTTWRAKKRLSRLFSVWTFTSTLPMKNVARKHIVKFSMRFLVTLLALLSFEILLAGSARTAFAQGQSTPSNVQYEQFTSILAKTWSNVTSRDPSELLTSLGLTLGMQTAVKSVVQKNFNDLCVPPSLEGRIRRVDTAVALSHFAYDTRPDMAVVAQDMAHMYGFTLIAHEKEASVYRPAYMIFMHDRNSSVVWVVVRGTSSIEDVFTDIAIEPEPFMDAHVHSGILRSARNIVRRVTDELGGPGRHHIWLTGHSLGGGAASIAAVELRNNGYDADAIAFGPPSCLSARADGPGSGRWAHAAFRRHVTSIIVEEDVVPRVTNESISRLIAPKDQVLGNIGSMIMGGVGSLLGGGGVGGVGSGVFDPLSAFVGVALGPGQVSNRHVPPGRLYLMERALGREWSTKEVKASALKDIILSQRMLSDHSWETYEMAVRNSDMRHMKPCDRP